MKIKQLLFITLTFCLLGVKTAAPIPRYEAPLPDMASSLPSYWHNHIKNLEIGLDREESVVSVPQQVIAEHFGYFEPSISGVCLYLPRIELETNSPLVFIVMHGTWARGMPEYWDPNNNIFAYLLDFAKELGHRHARPVEIVSYEWPGTDSPLCRQESGKKLRMVLDGFYNHLDGYGPRWGYGHSHAGNIFNLASQETDFDTLIYCGTPVVEGTQEMYRPLNIKKLYHIYSTNDPWQLGGSYDRRSLKTFFKRKNNGRSFQTQDSKRIVNVRVQCEGIAPGHLYIKWVIPHFWPLIDVIEENYLYHSNLDANVFSSPDHVGDEMPMVTIRKDLSLREMLPRITRSSDGMQIADQLSREMAYSEKQERLFSARYRGRDIHRENAFSDWFYTNWRELGDTIVKTYPWLREGGCKKYCLLEDIFDY